MLRFRHLEQNVTGLRSGAAGTRQSPLTVDTVPLWTADLVHVPLGAAGRRRRVAGGVADDACEAVLAPVLHTRPRLVIEPGLVVGVLLTAEDAGRCREGRGSVV